MRCPGFALCLLALVSVLMPPALIGAATAAGISAASDPAHSLDLAASHERAERFDEAERIYREILAGDTAHFEASFRLGRLLLRAGRLDDAIVVLERIAGTPQAVPVERLDEAIGLLNHVYALRAREWVDALKAGEADHAAAFVFGRGLVNLRRWDDGRRLLEELARQAPEDAQVHYWLAQALLNLGQGEQGRQSLERSVALAPGNLRLRLELAQVYQQQGALSEAGSLLEEIIAQSDDPDLDAEARRRLAAVHARQAVQAGDANAEAALRAAIELDPGNISLRMQLGAIYENENRLDEAIETYEDAGVRVIGVPHLMTLVQSRLRGLYARKADLLTAAILDDGVDPDEVLELARKMSQLDIHEAVVRLLQPSIRAFPANAQFHFWYGRSLLSLGEFDRGVAAIEQSVELSPPNPLLLMELGKAYARAGRLDEAEPVFQEIMALARDPNLQRRARSERDQVRARKLEQAQDYAGALSVIDALLADEPQDRFFLIERGRMLLLVGRHEEADALLDRLLAESPTDKVMRLRLAQAYQQAGRGDRAVALYQELIALDPGAIRLKIELGKVHLEGRDYDRAFAAFAEVFSQVRAMPPRIREQAEGVLGTLSRELIEHGLRALQAGDLAAAEQVLSGLAMLEPDHPHAHYLLSEVYRERRDYPRQAEYLERVVALAPGNLLMQRRLAIAWARAERPDKAVPLLERAIAVLPLDSELRMYLAEGLEAQGEAERARMEYVRLLELSPTEEWRIRALERLGLARTRTALERGDAREAVEQASRLVAQAPDDPDANLVLARAWRLSGEADKAEEVYLGILERARGHPAAQLDLAQLYAETGREDEAIPYLHALAEASPPVGESASARSRLNSLLLARARGQIDAADTEKDRQLVRAELTATGAYYFELEAYAAALVIFEYLIRNEPDSAEAYFWFGRLHTVLDRHSDSIVLLKRSVDLDPENPRYLATLGRAYRENQLPGPAIEALELAVALDDADMGLRLELAALHEAAGDAVRARQDYIHILSRAADDDLSRQAIAALELPENPDHLEGADLGPVLRWFSPETGRLPASAASRLYMAGILARLGHGDDAVAMLTDIADGEGSPRVRQEAERRLIDLLSLRAATLAADLDRGAGDPVAARILGMTLVQRRQPEQAIGILAAAVRSAPGDPQAWYWLGRANMLSDRVGPGIAALERSVILAQDNMLLRFELGLGYQRAGQLTRAGTEFERVAEQADDPGLRQEAHRLLAMMRGQQKAAAGDFAGALEQYQIALALAPRDTMALLERGKMLTLLGRQAEADRTFDLLLRIAPGDPGIRMQLASIYRGRGEFGKSLAQLAAVIRLDPDSAEAGQAREQLGFRRGVSLLQEGEFAEAAEVFERILTVVPEDPVTRFELGRAYYQQRRLAEAEIQFADVIRRDPGHQEAHLYLGRLYEVLERNDSAQRAYETVLEIDNETAVAGEALPPLAGLYSQSYRRMVADGRIDEAALLMQRLVNFAPNNVQARVDLARLYLQINRSDDALRELNAAIRMQPDHAEAQRLAGIIHAGAGRNRQAVEAYAAAIAGDRDSERADAVAVELVMVVVRQMLDEHRPFSAIRHLRGLVDAGRANERVWFTLSVIYRQQGNNQDAIIALREAVRLAPDGIQIRFNLAELYERENHDDLALVQYRDIVRRGAPGDRFVEESRRRAERLRNTLALFSSQMRYSISLGDTVLRDQDIDQTGALNSAFNSQLFYNLATNFRPSPPVRLQLDTGLIYIGNHSTEDDILIPRVGLAANINYPEHFYSGAVHVTEVFDLMRDISGGRTVNASLSGGFRFRDHLALMRWRRPAAPETGEPRLERAAERRIELEPGIENPRLHAALRRHHEAARTLFDIEADEAARVLEQEQDALRKVEEGMALYRTGWILARQGRLEQAAERFESLLRLVPDDPMTLVNLGIIHQRRQQMPEAEQVFLAALTADPRLHLARVKLAEVYAESGRLPEAMKLIDAALDAPDLSALEREVAVARRQRFTEMQQDDGGGTDEDSHHALLVAAGFDDALEHIVQRRYERARALLQDMLSIFPDDPLLRLNVGVIHLRQGRTAEAETEFQRVLDDDPRNLNAVLRLGMLYGETQRPALALTMLERVVAEGGGQPIVARAELELDRLERHRLRTLTGADAEQRDPIEKRLQAQVFFSDSTLPGRSLTETYSYGLGLSLSLQSVRRGEWVFNYIYGVRENEDPLGTDYAHDWHQAGVTWRSAIPNIGRLFGTSEYIPGMSGLAGLSYERRAYVHIDTHASNELAVLRRRIHTTTTLTLGLNYFVPGYEEMSYFLNYTRGVSRSNLPVGFVHDADGNPVAFQSSGLGNFDSNFLTVGLSFRF